MALPANVDASGANLPAKPISLPPAPPPPEPPETPEYRGALRFGVVVILAFFGNIFFWSAFEQAGTSLDVFAAQSTDRNVFGYEFPATWYQSVNALTIIICAPIVRIAVKSSPGV